MKKHHEIASIFPLMQGDEYEALKADIAEHGQREPIWLHPDESIIDGRNRYRACIELGIEPKFKIWDGQGSLVAFVVSLNLHRRHLTSSQRAAISPEILPMLEAEAKQRQLATQNNDAGKAVKEIIPEQEKGQARDKAAELLNTNSKYVQDAKTLAVEAPDLLEEVKTGEKTMPQANRELAQRNKQDIPPLPSDKYRVWYVDPPWLYDNSEIVAEEDDYSRVQRHYPAMSIEELCAMGPDIKERSAKDAVLFLWVTSPKLNECWKIIEAWGFKYKTSFVWDKVGHNFGHYNSIRHEFLLICGRGKSTPDSKTLIDSVVEVPKSKKHSEKPERFREIIDELYTHGKRIELFARTEVEGWEAWGNEPG